MLDRNKGVSDKVVIVAIIAIALSVMGIVAMCLDRPFTGSVGTHGADVKVNQPNDVAP